MRHMVRLLMVLVVSFGVVASAVPAQAEDQEALQNRSSLDSRGARSSEAPEVISTDSADDGLVERATAGERVGASRQTAGSLTRGRKYSGDQSVSKYWWWWWQSENSGSDEGGDDEMGGDDEDEDTDDEEPEPSVSAP